MIEQIVNIHWNYRLLLFLLAGAALALPLIFALPSRFLLDLAKKDYGSPNWMSIDRAPITVVGQFAFFYFGLLYAASSDSTTLFLLLLLELCSFLVVVFGLSLDRLDGREVKVILCSFRLYREEWPAIPVRWVWLVTSDYNDKGEKVEVRRQIILEDWVFKLMKPQTRIPMFWLNEQTNELRLTGIGEWLDPLIDKITLLPTFVYLAYRGLLYWPVALLMVASEVFSTLLRPPFIDFPQLAFLRRLVRETKAGPFGKTKFVLQFVTLLSAMPAAGGWLRPADLFYSCVISSSILGLGLMPGVLSSLFRLRPMQDFLKTYGLSKLYQRFRRGYDHEVDEKT